MTKDQKQQFHEWLTSNLGINESMADLITRHVDHYFLAPVPADPDDEKAAVKYAQDIIGIPASVMEQYELKDLERAFLAGCAHKAQELAKYGDMASALSKAGQEIERLRQALNQTNTL